MKDKYTAKHVSSGIRNGQEINLRGDSGQGFSTPNLSEFQKELSPYDKAILYYVTLFSFASHKTTAHRVIFSVSIKVLE